MYSKCIVLVCFLVGINAYPGILTLNSDGTSGVAFKTPLGGNTNNIFSAIGSAGFNAKHQLNSATGGLALDNKNGFGLSLTDTHIPSFGEKLTAAGNINLFHNDNHDLTANAFATRNIPNNPQIPNFNTVGGGLDYMFKNKIGASVDVSHTDLFNRNDYSVGGKLNLFRNPTTSLDFNAGLNKFVTPFVNSGWKPAIGLTLSKLF